LFLCLFCGCIASIGEFLHMSGNRLMLDLDLVWTAGAQPRHAVDPELFAVLDAIRLTGKLTEAAARVGLPYRKAWGLVAKWSETMGQPLVIKEQGRGTRLSPLGERLLWIRERINARLSPHLESAASEAERQLSTVLSVPDSALCIYASHDLALTELRDFLRIQNGPKLDLRFVGSLDGVVALCKSRCDVAGFHIPEGALGDEVSRKYRPWLKPRLQRLIHFVRRTQGLIVTPDNPKRIYGLSDIAKTKARFINRQRGSGTRLALERLLEEKGIDKEEITGYYSEEFTHLAVAAAVAGGVADVGLGIEAAARKLNMAFIPLFAEDYYLLTRADTVEQPDFQNLLSVLRGAEFRGFVNSLPGYDGSKAGTVMMIGDALKLEG